MPPWDRVGRGWGRGYNPPGPPGQAGLPRRAPPPKIPPRPASCPPPVPGVDDTLLRSWLGLPPGAWPPDHYTLLEFAPGAADPAAVEPRVMERMTVLRRHQLLHPDLVTEGMNRLAQALVTLTDPASKAAYDAELGIAAVVPPAVPEPPRVTPDVTPLPAGDGGSISVVVAEPVFDDDVFGDDTGPTDLPNAEVTQVIELPPTGGLATPYEVVADHPTPPPPLRAERPPADTPAVVEGEVLPDHSATSMSPADRRWMYGRLAVLRRTMRAWDRLRPILGDPQDPVDRPGRILLFLEGVWAVRPLLPRVRGIVGGAGEPGGVVAAVIVHPLVLDTFRRLLPDQRQALAIDWRRGQVELQREYARLRRLARQVRVRASRPLGGLTLLRLLRDVPEVVLLVLAGLALLVALVRAVRHQ